jgi:hypothetical protein
MKITSAISSQDAARAGAGSYKAEQTTQRGSLARPVLTEKTEHPTGGNGEIEAVQGKAAPVAAPVGFGDPHHLDDRFHHGRTNDQRGMTDRRCCTRHPAAGVSGARLGAALRGWADDEPPHQGHRR